MNPVAKQVRHQVWDKFYHQVWNQVFDQVSNQIWNQVFDEDLINQVFDKMEV